MIEKMKPYKACRHKKMVQNRGTRRLKTFRQEANRAVRIRMRAALRKHHLYDGKYGDYNNFFVAAGYWD